MILANEPVELDNKLSEWLPGTGTWRICWRGTEHGFAAPTFHEKCNEKKPSLVIVKVVTGAKSLIFGGYCTETWAGELNEKEDITQVNTLIYTMGDQAEDILNSFKLNATQLKDYKTFKEKFDSYFVVRRNHKKSWQEENNKATGKSNKKDFPGKQSCFRCGKNPSHIREKCPARNSTCNKCSKVGHSAKVCRTKVVAETGADETCIPLLTYESKKSKFPALKKSKKKLQSCDGKKLGIYRKFAATIEADEKITKAKFVETVKTCSDEAEPNKKWKRQSPKLFKRIKNEYTIKLKSDAKLHIVYTPRKIAHPRLPKVKNEVDSWMEKMGVISKIGTPTEWCSHMVVVPKSNGYIRICLDPSKLNESILRQAHHLPSVDYTLAMLAGSTVFSKLDCNSGFWQIPLSEESAPITTFITQWGRYHFNVLPFGITPASEHFPKQLEMILKDCEGVCIEIDDIPVHGEDTKEYDERLKKVLQKLEEENVTLNGDKCEFSKPELYYPGHVINATGINADPEKVRAITEMSSPNSTQEAR
ncbi:Retrovirus-related Pol poly from transposon opus [Paramuricea clavata]|uniref:Retrovirus-related Pol poly from transposon opus n=1 Tax=Paramuricea clavata TaxID=317549 RepID=A0A7D9E8Y5_PARCT|nr:Retrovirus-related Pol poly from transposon opus [Paramuricea clavata]